MPIEIERKFLVNLPEWERATKGEKRWLMQGYLLNTPEKTIRVRVDETKGYLTIKGKTTGFSRAEFEYEIPGPDALQLLNQFAGNCIEKTRYLMPHQGHLWEVDVFSGENEGLIVAEIELKHEAEVFALPDWIGKEVTDDARYYNAALVEMPFKKWS